MTTTCAIFELVESNESGKVTFSAGTVEAPQAASASAAASDPNLTT